MKKINLFLVSLLAVITLSVNLSSCSKDDPVNNEIEGNIVGKWILIETTLNGEKQPVFDGEFLEIKSDGTFLEYDYAEELISRQYSWDHAVGNWKQTNGKLELNYDSEKTYELYPNQGFITYIPFAYTIDKLNDKTLVLSGSIAGYTGINTYQRQ